MPKLRATLMRPYEVWTYCSVSISCARGTPLLELPRCFPSFEALCALCAGGLDSHWTGPVPAAGPTGTLQKQGQRFRWSSNIFCVASKCHCLFPKDRLIHKSMSIPVSLSDMKLCPHCDDSPIVPLCCCDRGFQCCLFIEPIAMLSYAILVWKNMKWDEWLSSLLCSMCASCSRTSQQTWA